MPCVIEENPLFSSACVRCSPVAACWLVSCHLCWMGVSSIMACQLHLPSLAMAKLLCRSQCSIQCSPALQIGTGLWLILCSCSSGLSLGCIWPRRKCVELKNVPCANSLLVRGLCNIHTPLFCHSSFPCNTRLQRDHKCCRCS